MDRPKSKGDHRAAGKKRLEEFRQKKQQKGTTNKSASTAIKALADADKSPSETPAAQGSSVAQQDNELHNKSDGQGSHLVGNPELGVESPQQVLPPIDDSPVPGDSKLGGTKSLEPEPLGESDELTSSEVLSSLEQVTKPASSEQNNGAGYENEGGKTSQYPVDSKISPFVAYGQFPPEELSRNGSTGDGRLDNASPNNSDMQPEQSLRDDKELQETVEHKLITEIEGLKGQLQTLVEEKEMVSNQLAFKAEQQLEDASKVKTLIADVEAIQQELSTVKNEKVQLVEEFTSSQMELQSSNQHLASELSASQEQVAVATHKVSLLSGELERAKQEAFEASSTFAVEMERMQNLVKGGESRIAQLTDELSTTRTLFEGLQNEKASLNDELGRFANELHSYGEELQQKGHVLEASKQVIQTLEEDLASKQSALQQAQDLVAEKSQLLEALSSAKEEELGSHGVKIRNMQSEKLGLVIQLEELNRHLEHARQAEEGLRSDLEAQQKASEEQLKQLQDAKAEQSDELEKSVLLSKRLTDEKSSLLAAFDVDLQQLRQELRKREEEYEIQGSQLLESRQDLQDFGDAHAHEVKQLEIALDECRAALNHERVESSLSLQELISEKDQLLLSIEEKGQDVVALGNQLQEHEHQLRTRVADNSSLATSLEESILKLQKSSKLASEFEAEVGRQKAVSDGLLEDKASLVADVLKIRAQCELMQQTGDEHVLDLERALENARGLEENNGKLLEELAKVRTDKEAVELELVAYREQVAKLEEQNSNLVKELEGMQKELLRAREDHLLSSSDFTSELEKQRVFSSELFAERDGLAQTVNEHVMELESVRENLRALEEDHSKLSSHSIISTDELTKVRAELAAYTEQIAVSEAQNFNLVQVIEDNKSDLQRAREQALELDRVRENLRGLEEDHSNLSSQSTIATDELSKVRAVKEAVELELVAFREKETRSEEQRSTLAKALEDTQTELQRVRDDHLLSSSDLATELDKQRELFSEQLTEKGRLESELRASTQKLQALQQEISQSGKEHIAELEELQQRLKGLEDNHSKSINDFTVSQNEMSVLKEEKSLADVELARCREQLTKLEDLNKVLVEGWDGHKEQLNTALDEQQRLLVGHVAELEKLREQQRDTEETTSKQDAHVQELLSDLEELKNEKVKLVSELEIYQRQYQELGDEKWKMGSDFNKCKDQLQLLIEEKTSVESMLEESKEMERKLKEDNASLTVELEKEREDQQNILQEKVNEIEKLQQRVEELVQSGQQTTMELGEAREQSQLMAGDRVEMQSNLEELSQKLNYVSKEKDVLQSDLDASKQQREKLVEEKGNLVSQFEGASESWKVEKVRLSRDLEVTLGDHQLLRADKGQVDSAVAELTLQTNELDAQRAQLALEVSALNEVMKSSVEQRARLVSEVEGKDQLLQTLMAEKSQLESHLQAEREKLTLSNNQLGQLSKDLSATKLRIEELELEIAQLRVDCEQSRTEVELLTEEKGKLTADFRNHLSQGEQRNLENEQKSLQHDEAIEEMRHVIESKEGELGQLETRCKFLETNLEVSNAERRDLAHDLASLKYQLQQISELKLQGGRGPSRGVKSSRQRGLGIEEMKHEPSLKVDEVAQDLPLSVAINDKEQEIAEDGQEPVHDVELPDRLEEISQNLGQEFREALSLVGSLLLEFDNQTAQLKKSTEENLLLVNLVEQLEGKQHQLDAALARADELDSQVKDLTGEAAKLQAEKGTALEALVAVQEELRQSKHNLVDEKALLEGRLLVVEETAATLQVERDELAGKLADLEQSLAAISERALQDSKDKVSLQDQVAEYSTELGTRKDMVKQSNFLVQSLVQKLEDVICDAFPEAGKELLSSQVSNDPAGYHSSLASRLVIEITEVCHQLKGAHDRLSVMSKEVQEAEDQLTASQKETSAAVETTQQIQSQLMNAAEEKKALESSLKRLEAFVNAANVRGDEQAMNFANLQAERDDLAGKIASLEQSHAHVSERALRVSNEKVSFQDRAAAFEAQVAEYATELKNQQDMVSQSNLLVQSLVQKVEDVICDAFPKAGEELLSSHDNKLTADYHNILAGRLHVEIAEVSHQLQAAHMQLSDANKHLLEAEDKWMMSQNEMTKAVETAEQIRIQLTKAAEEKDELQTSLKRLEAETVKVDERAITSTNRESEVEGLLHQIQTLHKQLEQATVEKDNLQKGLAQADQKLSLTREKLSLAVNKGKAVVQQRDAWKLSLAEKSKEMDLLVVNHQQDLQHKDAALHNAERKIVDLASSVEQMAWFQKMISTAEQAILENEDLVHTLCAVLANDTILPDDWSSSELANKILWIIGCVIKLLQELELRKEETQTLMENATALTSSFETSESKVTALVVELRSLELEKEALVSRLEDRTNQLGLERVQMMEEKSQLTGIIRQQDADIETLKREKDDLATKLLKQTEEIVKLETEISSLVTKVTEQEWDVSNRTSSYNNLHACVNSLLRELSDCYQTISPVDSDAISSHSSLDRCKYVLKLLITNHNLTVVKLKEIVREASALCDASEESVNFGPLQSLDDKTSSKQISSGLLEAIEDSLASVEQQAVLLVEEQSERTRLQLDLKQKEERLSAIREKLSAAVSKGKSLVQQRDSLKQALMEKNTELDALTSAHKEGLNSREILLQESSNRLTSSLEHAAGLERDFAALQNSVASNHGPSLADRLSEKDRQLGEAQDRAYAAESEATVVLSKLEVSHTRVASLVEEVNSLTKEKEGLVNKYTSEIQDLSTARTQLMAEISDLKQDLATGAKEREKLVQDHLEVSDQCNELRSQTEDVLAERGLLLAQTDALQQRISELILALESEKQARMKLESDTEAVVAKIQGSTGEPVVERSLDSHSQANSLLDSLSTLLVLKHEAALQEIQELAEQKALLAESQKTMMGKALSERQMFEELQQAEASRDLALREVHQRLEEASKDVREEVRVLKEELARASAERDALQSELQQAEQKGATTREKLGLAIKKGKGVAQQRDLLKQSLSEQHLLVTNYKDELQNKESALKKATSEVSTCEGKIRALELNVSYKDNLMKKMEAVLTKWDSPSEWQSRDITEKLEWLVSAVSNAQNSLITADQEADALKKASAQLISELRDAQRRATLEQESRSALAIKLEESLRGLEQSQKRIAELESLLVDLGGVGQQTERLTREVLDLQKAVQQKQAEVERAEEAVNAWVKRSEESEKYIQLCQGRISELEQIAQTSIGVQQQIELLHDKIAHLEEALEQKEAAVKAMETSRGKAVNKLTLTTNKFRELYQQSEGLVVELERMHKNLQEKDAEVTQLKEEAATISSQSRISQDMLESKRSFQLHLDKLLEAAVLSAGADSATSPPTAEKEASGQQTDRESDDERLISHVNSIRSQLSGLTAQSQARQAEVEKKDVQLQGLQKEFEEVVAERTQLKANLQREQIQSERLRAELATSQAPVTERGANQTQEIEEVQASKRSLPISTPTPHVRMSARRPAPIEVAIDVDSEMKQLVESNPVDFDDKGHGFKSLASSKFMPRGTRAIGEQIDKLCVAGGRVLMRRPAARLMVTLYWLAIHIWMAFLISAAHV